MTTPAPWPANEAQRLQTLLSYGVLDSGREQAFDDLTIIASALCDAPISLVSLIDADRQWFKSAVGLDVQQTSRDMAFCAHAILQPETVFTVEDALGDARFASNPLVTGEPKIRFYAGVPLLASDGHALGTLCVIDRKPRRLQARQQEALQALARQVVRQLELRRSLVQATECSLTDVLTGASNRRAAEARLELEWDRCGQSGAPLSLLLLDIDDFKGFNDAFGHSEGDEVLRQLTAVARRCLRGGDLFARWGGEEFAVVLPGLGVTEAAVCAERLRSAIEQAAWPRRAVTASIGVAAMHPSPASSVHALVHRADFALYEAKSAGRNRVHGFTAELAFG